MLWLQEPPGQFLCCFNILCNSSRSPMTTSGTSRWTVWQRAIELGILLPSSKGKQMPLSAKNAAFTIPTCQSRANSKPTINTLKRSPFPPQATPTHGNKKSKIWLAIVLSLFPPSMVLCVGGWRGCSSYASGRWHDLTAALGRMWRCWSLPWKARS